MIEDLALASITSRRNAIVPRLIDESTYLSDQDAEPVLYIFDALEEQVALGFVGMRGGGSAATGLFDATPRDLRGVVTIGTGSTVIEIESFPAVHPSNQFVTCTYRTFNQALPTWGVSPATTSISSFKVSPASWWENVVYDYAQRGETRKALRTLFRSVEDLFAKRNLELLNRSLDRIDLKKLTPDLMVGLVRSTYRARKALPAWMQTLRKVEAELAARNVPHWERLLVGLS